MQKRRLTWWISTALIVLLFALTGCQAVQGLDIAQAFQNHANITSSVSKGTLQLELIPDHADALTPENKTFMDSLQNTKIEITNANMQDAQHLSADGSLTYSKGSIPFKLNIDGTKVIIKIDGAPKPIVFDPLTATEGRLAGALSLLPQGIKNELGHAINSIEPALVKFILNNAPNPKNITVTSASEPVNGETLALQKAHVELNGTELTDLLKTVLGNILADEEGLKELISQLYDALLPIINEQSTGESSTLTSLLKNKSLAVGFVYSSVRQALEEAAAGLDKAAPLSNKATLKADFFIDADKQLRKQNLELYMPVAKSDNGVSAFKLTLTSETWNINKPVKADMIDVSGGTLNFGAGPSSLYSLLSQLDKQSKLYKFLKEDLRVTKKKIQLQLGEAAGNDDPDSLNPFINADGVTMVPVRFVSEQLGAEVKWNGELKQVTIKDALTGTVIILTLDDKTASVNGSASQLESAAALHNSSTFVPVRFIAEKLGSKVAFDNATRVVTIKRD
ncbi:copper amine oxidase N-terminal domain-containing protein [Paenibacillus sedimenti]|uniref:Copper amine oxidase N-terminal domain-containing protein n=1 Tax=Paenibacillus sedimenti TaxID=2770274 RepID=A0A926KR79_9BACL|nr:copper amine oxidase N-terminal domain-containing protein [Paenibacillus sedimenti]MBD0382470.1 copper amine oxidase N-terminal domain-containing protein [Paenibacillus sedimenti]